MLQKINEIMVPRQFYKDLFNTYERKSFLSVISIKIVKNKLYKYMTLVSKKVYIDKLDHMINKKKHPSVNVLQNRCS